MKHKKAVFFTIDAVIALTIILLVILVAYPIVKTQRQESLLEEDLIEFLSSAKIGEINDSYTQNLISQGKIKDKNLTIIEQIGEFYVTNKTIAKALANSVLSSINASENIGLWYGNTLIASKNLTSYSSATNVDVQRQLISGISDTGGSVKGYSSRAFLTGSLSEKY